jgi:hypothetical protein
MLQLRFERRSNIAKRLLRCTRFRASGIGRRASEGGRWKSPRVRFRSILLEGLELRRLMAADVAPDAVVSILPAALVASPIYSTAHQDIGSEKQAALEGIGVLMRISAQPVITPSVTDSSNLAQAAALVEQGVPLTPAEATQLQWQDFDSRTSSLGTIDSELLRRVSAQPSRLQRFLFGQQIGLQNREANVDATTVAGSINLSQSIVELFSHPNSTTVENIAPLVSSALVSSNLSVGKFCNPYGSHASATEDSTGEGEGHDLYDPSFDSGEPSSSFTTGSSGSGTTSATGGSTDSTGSTTGQAGDANDAAPLPVPTIDFPVLEISRHNGSLDTFAPPASLVADTVEYVGAFDETTTPDSNLEVPGVNWVHRLNVHRLDDSRWSISETLILGYSISVAVPIDDPEDTPDSSNQTPDMSSSNTSSSSGDLTYTSDAGQPPITGDLVQTASSSLIVTRFGFLVLSFHAEQGITTPVEAGVKWSLNLSFSDTIGVTMIASHSASITPAITGATNPQASSQTPAADDSSGSSSSSTSSSLMDPSSNTGDSSYLNPQPDSPPAPAAPSNFRSSSSSQLTLGVQVSAVGGIAIGSTPMLVHESDGTSVERDVTYSDNISVTAASSILGVWAATSGSGDIYTPDPSLALPAAPPEVAAYFAPDNAEPQELAPAPQDSSSNSSQPLDRVPADGVIALRTTEGGAAWGDKPAEWTPVTQPVGRGHEAGNSGSMGSNVSNTTTSGLNFRAKIRGNNELTSLAGSLRSGFANRFGDKVADNEVLVFSDGGTDGSLHWKGTLARGNQVDNGALAMTASEMSIDLALGADQQIETSPGATDSSILFTRSESGGSFELLNIEASSMTEIPGGWSSWSGSLTEGSGHSSSIGGSLATGATDETDSGTLKLKTSANGFEHYAISSISFGQFSTPYRDGAGGETTRLNWTVTFSGSGELENSLAEGIEAGGDNANAATQATTENATDDSGDSEDSAAPTVTSAASATHKSTETISYFSVKRNHENGRGFDGSISESDYFRKATYNRTRTRNNSESFNSATETETEQSSTTAPPSSGTDGTSTPSSDSGSSSPGTTGTTPAVPVERVEIVGHYHYNYSGPTDNGWVRQNLATGEHSYSYNSGDIPVVLPIPENFDPRTDFERWLDGSGAEPTEPEPEELPEIPEEYLHNPYSGDTWLSWLAGRNGDAGDQAINFGAGFADNVTMNASWYWRNKMLGTDTVDYNSTAYSAGGWTAFAVQLPGGVKAVAGAAKSAYGVVNSFDDMGRCLNTATKLIHGGCFVAGTLVTLSETPNDQSLEAMLWGDDAWQDERGGESPATQSVAVTKRTLTPIEQVPLGARVPTKNPKPWEFDDSLPEPVQDEWLKLSITVERTDGGVVDAELLRPRAWVEANSIRAGQLLPLNIAELQVAGFAHVTAIEPCLVIAAGDGSVITGRFVTRQVDTIARVEILGADGSIELLEGTTIHPIWSLDRNDWVPLGELEQGEQLLAQAGPATVLSVTILNLPTAVYNIEVHGEHVYEVGVLGLLVHNVCPAPLPINRLAQHGSRVHDQAMKITANAIKNLTVRTNQVIVDGTTVLSRLRPDIQWIENGLINIIEINKSGGSGYYASRLAELTKALGAKLGTFDVIDI